VWISGNILDDVLQSVGKIGQSAVIYVANQVVLLVPIIWNLLVPDVFSMFPKHPTKRDSRAVARMHHFFAPP
jgi:hypothetical protein